MACGKWACGIGLSTQGHRTRTQGPRSGPRPGTQARAQEPGYGTHGPGQAGPGWAGIQTWDPGAGLGPGPGSGCGPSSKQGIHFYLLFYILGLNRVGFFLNCSSGALYSACAGLRWLPRPSAHPLKAAHPGTLSPVWSALGRVGVSCLVYVTDRGSQG